MDNTYTHVDKSTGEVLSRELITRADMPLQEQEDQEIDLVFPMQRVPLYRQMLDEREDLSVEEREGILSLYESRSLRRPFKDFLGEEIEIIGGIIWEHPPFRLKKDGPEGPLQQGYEKILFLTTRMHDTGLQKGLPVVIEVSAGALSNHVYAMLSLGGKNRWFLFPDGPVVYKLMQDSRTNAFSMINMDSVRERFPQLKKGTRKEHE